MHIMCFSSSDNGAEHDLVTTLIIREAFMNRTQHQRKSLVSARTT